MDWERDHEWVLHRSWNDLTRVTIRFQNAKPSLSELAAIRRCLPQYRDMAPAAARTSIGETGQLPLGVMPTPEARGVIEIIQKEGFIVDAECASYVSYMPLDKTTSCALLIENEAEAKAVVQSMLAAGVPVQQIEA
jgi:hypothetical protein